MDSNGLYYRLLNTQNVLDTNPLLLYKCAKNDRSLIQRLSLQKKLPVHNGCVNSICWNQSGHYILSGSDDQHLCVTQAYTYEILASVRTGHRTNIFSAKFLPNTSDRHVVSCSGDGMTIFTDLERPDTSLVNLFNCHFGTAYEVTTVPNDPHTFLTCGEDGTVRWFDLRVKNSCSTTNCSDDILVHCSYAITALAVNHTLPYYLSIGCADSTVRTYDRRMLTTKALGDHSNDYLKSMVSLFKVEEFENKNHRITSLCYSPDAQEMLVSYSSDYIYLFEAKERGGSAHSKQLSPFGLTKQKLSPTSSSSSSRPLMKRLRVRGDWSDTGPNARPERERTSTEVPPPPQPLHSNLMQRMSDVLTRIFNSPQRQSDDNSDNSQRPTDADSNDNPNENNVSNIGLISSDNNISDNPLEVQTSSYLPNQTNAGSSTVSQNTFLSKPQYLGQELADNQSIVENVERDRVGVGVADGETVVNLQYCGQGVNSGTITVESAFASNSNMSSTQMNDESNSGDINNMDDTSNSRTSEPMTHFEDNNDSNMGYESQNENLSNDLAIDGEEDNESSANSRSGNQLFNSFDDVLKHLKEERDYERSQLPNVSVPVVKQRFTGHRNARTMIKEATFWGDDYIMSGSDCGHIFVWSRYSAELIMILEGDHHVVNCLQPHPFDPILASSGIDYDIKIWSPLNDEPFFDREKAEEITSRNEVMLEETKDTITVPASFMIRMLTSLNHFRSNRASSRWRRIGAAARAAAERSE